ncbi:MAG: hypothetical protein OCD03_13095 [Hyphomicrobiales bacterium]
MSQLAEIGHNSGETELSQFEKLGLRSDELYQGALRFELQVKGGIQTDEMANKAADFRKQIKGQITLLGKARKADKEPHLEAGRKVDADYKGLTSPLETAVKIIDTPLLAYSQKKEAQRQADLKAQREEQAKKEREAQEAMRKAQESEKLADKVAADKALEQASEATNTVEKADVQKTSFGNSAINGRATSVRMQQVITAEINDSEKAAALFHSHPSVITAIEKVAADLFKADANLKLDGITKHTTDKLR